ncbi:MAG: hypothetical protein IKR77_04290 [Bacteroidales bacterium]|nr:hypothetical protein [Bacteroidales bacterium]MBR6333595.1 hypothetical protein [Bacteroidales bacterium]
MKKIIALCLAVTLFCMTGCQKFKPATVELKACSANGKTLTGTAVITDNGGCTYFIEQGFCFSLFKKLSASDVYTTVVTLNNSCYDEQFEWTYDLPMVDTVYYVCAYVKTNAGISYSEIDSVSTIINN